MNPSRNPKLIIPHSHLSSSLTLTYQHPSFSPINITILPSLPPPQVVASDNGGPLEETRASNFPLRGGKTSWLEGGIRTTAWVTGGLLPTPMRGKNLSSAHPIAMCDWHSTFVALAGAGGDDGDDVGDEAASQFNEAQGQPLPGLDGINQWPVISGASNTPLRTEIFVGSGVLIQGRYKLIANSAGNRNACRWTGPLYPKVGKRLIPT